MQYSTSSENLAPMQERVTRARTRPSSSSGSSYLAPPPVARAMYAPEQPRSSTSTFRIPTPTLSYSSHSNAAHDYPASSSYYTSATSSTPPTLASPEYDNYSYTLPPAPNAPRPHTSYSTSYTTNSRQPGMSRRASLLDADVDFDQFRRNSDSASSDITYYADESAYAAAGTADEQIVGLPAPSRHSSISSASSGLVESFPSRNEITTTLSSSCHCQLCGWTTALSENFDTHLRAHDGDCLFQCFLDGCEAAFSDSTGLLAHTKRHRPCSADSSSSNKRSWREQEEVDRWVHTPQQMHKKVRVEPITPITPSMYGDADGAAVQQQQRAVMPTISRTLSYHQALPVPPKLPRYHSYDGVSSRLAQPDDGYHASVHLPQPNEVPSSSTVVTTFTIPSTPGSASSSSNSGFLHHPPTSSPVFSDASPSSGFTHQTRRHQLLASPVPLNATSSAPVDRGQFDPYPHSLLPSSSSMSVSYSLPPPPEHFSTPPRGRTIHSRRIEQQQQYGDDGQGQYYQQEEPQYYHSHQLSSPVSPAQQGYYPPPPALVPIPSSSHPGSHDSSRRPSSSSASASYTPSQAALVNAASMNRLLARLPPPPSPYQYQHDSPSSPLAPSYTPSPGRGVNAVHPRYREPAPPSPYNLAASAQTRTQEKVHACTEENCGKRFKRLEHLKRHEKTHTDEKPFMCDVPGCERYFSRSDNLQQHRKTHEKNGKTARAMAAAAAAKAAAQVVAGMGGSVGGGDY
ncbi:hypothetical protein JCM11251_001790 [Rhodosporidiobolus azoricus]